MGSASSKTSPLGARVYAAVIAGNLNEIKDLHSRGASLEYTANGESPLLHACARSDGFDCAKLLVDLGANVHVGGAGGYAVHVAARAGHNRTLTMLVDKGASLLVVDVCGNTPLEVAKGERHVTTVRLIESRICLFSANMREQVECASKWIPAFRGLYDSVWVVLLPIESSLQQLEILVYTDASKFIPTTRFPLKDTKCQITKPESNSPIFLVENYVSKSRLLLLGGLGKDKRGEESQVEALLRACQTKQNTNKPPIPAHPIPPQSIPTDSPPFYRPFARTDMSKAGVPKSSIVTPPQIPHRAQNNSLNSEVEDLESAIRESLRPEYMSSTPTPQPRPQPYSQPNPNSQPIYHPQSGSQSGAQSQPQPPPSGRNTRNNVRGQNNPTPSAPPFVPNDAYSSAQMRGAGMGAGGQRGVNRDGGGGGGGDMEEKCAICWEESRDVACVPCGHVACCKKCLTTVFEIGNKECPTCRVKLKGVLKVYL